MARRRPTTHGVCIVDKPTGVTSHDVVGMLRRRFGERQVGHAGTLDPGATGVLVVGVGAATRLLRFVEATTKRYHAEVVLGSETSTLDADGNVTATYDMSGVGVDDARATVAAYLLGEIDQIPPMVSAIKIDGKRLHELARQGIEVERPPRRVTIESFDVDPGPERGVLAIDVVCSAGTYVRTLAADLGRLLGGGAHLRNLRRTAVGSFTIERSAPPDRCELLPVSEAVAGLARIDVDTATAALIAHGRVLPRSGSGRAGEGVSATTSPLELPAGEGPWAMFAPTRELLAVYEPHSATTAKPAVVLAVDAG